MTAEERFDTLYREHRSSLKSFIHSRIRVSADAEEVLQEFWLDLIEQVRKSPQETYSRKYLFQSADWKIKNLRELRQSRYRRLESLDQPVEFRDGDEGLPQPPAPVGDIAEDLHGAMAELTPELREVVTRHFFGGESLAAIGASSGMKAMAICKRLRKALVQLRHSISVKGAPGTSHTIQIDDGRTVAKYLRFTHAVETAYNLQSPVFRERLSNGRWIYQHRVLDPHWLNVAAEGYRNVCLGEVVAPTARPSAIRKRYNDGTSRSAQIQKVLAASPDLPVKVIAEMFGVETDLVRAAIRELKRKRARCQQPHHGPTSDSSRKDADRE